MIVKSLKVEKQRDLRGLYREIIGVCGASDADPGNHDAVDVELVLNRL